MAIPGGPRFGPYDILAPLGAGGMGDTRGVRTGRALDGICVQRVREPRGVCAALSRAWRDDSDLDALRDGADLEPEWHELFYRSGTPESQQFFSVAIRSLSPFRADPPRLLFEAATGTYDSTTALRSWNVGADGAAVSLPRLESSETMATSMHVVLNWSEELKRLVPAK